MSYDCDWKCTCFNECFRTCDAVDDFLPIVVDDAKIIQTDVHYVLVDMQINGLRNSNFKTSIV